MVASRRPLFRLQGDDLRDPLGWQAGWALKNTGADVYTVYLADGTPQTATISCTTGGPGVATITYDFPAGYYAGGGFRNY